MRRAFVLLVLGAALSGIGLTLAAATAAAPVPRAQVGVERDVRITGLKADGFVAGITVDNNDGTVTATLIVSRGPQAGYYSVPATVTAERVTARFGRMGELDYRFAPPPDADPKCFGTGGESPVSFEGTFTFTGERGYVHIDADRAEGTFSVSPPPAGCPTGLRARRVVPYSPSYGGPGATLEVTIGSRARGPFRTFSVFDGGEQTRHGHHRLSIFSFLAEKREGMGIARGVRLVARSGAFRRNLRAGTATVRPPAPFTGSAHLARRAHRRPTWTGSLRMPILGGDPVALAGPGSRAVLHKGTPQDE